MSIDTGLDSEIWISNDRRLETEHAGTNNDQIQDSLLVRDPPDLLQELLQAQEGACAC